jgi:hypothetical protein
MSILLPLMSITSNQLKRISLSKRTDPVILGTSDTLKLTFQVADHTTDKGLQPHQTFLRFFDSTSGEEGIQPVKVVSSGKAKFELVCISFQFSQSQLSHNHCPPPPKTNKSEHGQAPEFSSAFRRRATARLSSPRLIRTQSCGIRPLRPAHPTICPCASASRRVPLSSASRASPYLPPRAESTPSPYLCAFRRARNLPMGCPLWIGTCDTLPALCGSAPSRR